jgi:DNA-binding NarL/FixJ family response regulator
VNPARRCPTHTSGGPAAGPSVLLAEPQSTLRTSLRVLLERAGFEICGEAAEADEAVAATDRLQPDLCIMEPVMPGDGIWAISVITNSADTEVVVLTDADDLDVLFDSIRAGAAGYLTKGMDPERIPPALLGVLAGEAAIPRTLVAALLTDLQSQGTRRMVVGRNTRAELTRREWEVAQAAAEGASTAEIGDRLFLSPVTVRRHLAEVVRKLGVEDRAAAIELLRASVPIRPPDRQHGGGHEVSSSPS